jgi:hypothetical protein
MPALVIGADDKAERIVARILDHRAFDLQIKRDLPPIAPPRAPLTASA